MKPEVLRFGALDMQVCVPENWDDQKIKLFADEENLCGTINGWSIRKDSDEALNGDPARNPCQGRKGFVHLTLDA